MRAAARLGYRCGDRPERRRPAVRIRAARSRLFLRRPASGGEADGAWDQPAHSAHEAPAGGRTHHVTQQAARLRRPVPADAAEGDGGPPRIAIKLNPRAKLRTERLPATVQTYLERVAPGAGRVAHIQPLITSQKPEEVDALVRRAAELDPTYEPADFGAWLQLELEPARSHEPPAGQFDAADPDDIDELVRRLHRLPEIDSAYALRAGPPPSPVNALDDPRATNQGYLNAAPQGIDARYTWGFAGGDGAGIGFVDLEQGWNLSHEDLAAAGITLISGANTAYYSHGTAVLGEVLQVDNTLGGVGIAPAGVGRVISQHQPGGYNTAAAIIDAVAHMAFGDVLLLEAQEYDPVGGQYYWPVEVADANYDAIRLATALGIVVVEAGCNGGYDLDAYVNLGGQAIFQRGAAGFRDSGAIMVGAGDATDPHARLWFSNHGSRVDVYAWGESVDTTSTDATGTDDTAYTGGFSGTSSASPIISGAAMVLQGIAEAGLGYRFSPRELRRLLVIGGAPSASPASDRIGVMPNLRAIIDGATLGLAPDHYLRDYVGDTGDPTGGGVSLSPDIIVRQAPVADPQGSFGEGSGNENNAALSEPVLAGHDHSVYVRLQNRGGSDDPNVAVDVFWSPPSTLVTPNLWNHIGTATLPSVPTETCSPSRARCTGRRRPCQAAATTASWPSAQCERSRAVADSAEHLEQLGDLRDEQQQRRLAQLRRRPRTARGRPACVPVHHPRRVRQGAGVRAAGLRQPAARLQGGAPGADRACAAAQDPAGRRAAGGGVRARAAQPVRAPPDRRWRHRGAQRRRVRAAGASAGGDVQGPRPVRVRGAAALPRAGGRPAHLAVRGAAAPRRLLSTSVRAVAGLSGRRAGRARPILGDDRRRQSVRCRGVPRSSDRPPEVWRR